MSSTGGINVTDTKELNLFELSAISTWGPNNQSVCFNLISPWKPNQAKLSQTDKTMSAISTLFDNLLMSIVTTSVTHV